MITKGYYHIISSNDKYYCNGLYHSWNDERIYTNRLHKKTVKKYSIFGFLLWIIFYLSIKD